MARLRAWKGLSILVALALVLSLGIVAVPMAGTVEAATINVPGDYATIQAAIDAASAGDIINVAAGTYTPAGGPFATDHYGLKFDATRGGITLRGANAGIPGYGTRGAESIIEGPNVLHGNAIYIFDGADGVVIDGFTLKAGDDIVENRADDVVIKNNIVTPISGTPADPNAPGIFACEANNLTVGYNWVRDTGGIGMFLGLAEYSADINGLVEHNLIEDAGAAGILVNYSTGGLVIERNTIGDAGHDGIRGGPSAQGITIEHNEIYGSARDGVRIMGDAASHHINYNGIHGSVAYGVNNLHAATLDASCNWWGTNTAAGVAGEVSANVDYTPWLDSGTDTDPGPGFQGDLSVLNVGADSPQTGATGRIQEGVNEVTASTVNVAAGTYNEAVTVNKAVTLKGANAGIPGTGTRGAESIVDADDPDTSTYKDAFDITSGNVMIDGFKTIDADEGIRVNCIGGDRKNVVIKNNYIDTTLGNPDTTPANIGASGIAFYNLGAGGALYSVDGAVVQDNYIYQVHSGSGGDSIWFQDVDGSITIKGNKVDGPGTGSPIMMGASGPHGKNMDIGGTVIEDNDLSTSTGASGIRLKRVTTSSDIRVTGNKVNNVKHAMYIGGFGISDATIVAESNDFSGNQYGIRNKEAVTLTAHFNNFGGNTNYGIKNEKATVTVDAEHNWWGDASGPGGVGPGTGDAVSANVDYDPWLGAPLELPALHQETLGAGTHEVDASDEADTKVTLTTTGDTEITIARYESQPFPEEPFPHEALGKWIDIYVSNPGVVVWPIYVEVSYTDAEVAAAGIHESSLGLYYYEPVNTFHRCSDTGVNTVQNFIWANVTQAEAGYLVGTAFGAGGFPPPTPRVPVVDQWGIFAMVFLFAGLLVWRVRRRRYAL